MTRWNEKRLDGQQSAMFDVMMDQIVPSMKWVDGQDIRAARAAYGPLRWQVCPCCDGRGTFCRHCDETGAVPR